MTWYSPEPWEGQLIVSCPKKGLEHDWYYNGPGAIRQDGIRLWCYQCARCGATTERLT
jgi:hypothetical protein